MQKTMYVYILSSFKRTLYVGATNNLERRLYEHKAKLFKGYTSKYNIDRLVHFEEYSDTYTAISREKEIKGFSHKNKISIIELSNARWNDLSLSFKDSSTTLRSVSE